MSFFYLQFRQLALVGDEEKKEILIFKPTIRLIIFKPTSMSGTIILIFFNSCFFHVPDSFC